MKLREAYHLSEQIKAELPTATRHIWHLLEGKSGWIVQVDEHGEAVARIQDPTQWPFIRDKLARRPRVVT